MSDFTADFFRDNACKYGFFNRNTDVYVSRSVVKPRETHTSAYCRPVEGKKSPEEKNFI